MVLIVYPLVKRAAPSWQAPEVASASPPCSVESRMEVSSIQGKPAPGAGIHRTNAPVEVRMIPVC